MLAMAGWNKIHLLLPIGYKYLDRLMKECRIYPMPVIM